jgi:hypothetical protein
MPGASLLHLGPVSDTKEVDAKVDHTLGGSALAVVGALPGPAQSPPDQQVTPTTTAAARTSVDNKNSTFQPSSLMDSQPVVAAPSAVRLQITTGRRLASSCSAATRINLKCRLALGARPVPGASAASSWSLAHRRMTPTRASSAETRSRSKSDKDFHHMVAIGPAN